MVSVMCERYKFELSKQTETVKSTISYKKMAKVTNFLADNGYIKTNDKVFFVVIEESI